MDTPPRESISTITPTLAQVYLHPLYVVESVIILTDEADLLTDEMEYIIRGQVEINRDGEGHY